MALHPHEQMISGGKGGINLLSSVSAPKNPREPSISVTSRSFDAFTYWVSQNRVMETAVESRDPPAPPRAAPDFPVLLNWRSGLAPPL